MSVNTIWKPVSNWFSEQVSTGVCHMYTCYQFKTVPAQFVQALPVEDQFIPVHTSWNQLNFELVSTGIFSWVYTLYG